MKKIIVSLTLALSLIFLISANFSASSIEAQSVNIVKPPEPKEFIQADLSNGRIIVGEPPNSAQTSAKPRIFKFNDIDKGSIILVNRTYPVEKDFSHSSLINLQGKVPSSKPELKLAEDAAEELIKLFEDAKKEGIKDLVAVSTYRPYSYQQYLYNRKVNFYVKQGNSIEKAKNLAATVVALPGTSEHQTGYAVDLSSWKMLNKGGLEEEFGKTKEGTWLMNNSFKYGFILRYPKDKQDLTKIIYEPWHYRYVGKPHAEIIFKKNMCLEEYIDYLKQNKKIEYTTEGGEKFIIYYLENAGNIKDVEVWAYTGQVVDVSLDNTGGLILTLTMD